MFTASWVLVQLRLSFLVCDRSVSVNVITHTFVGLKCLTETKIHILCDHVSHTRLHTVEMGCQMVQLLSAHIVGPTMCVNLTPALQSKRYSSSHAVRLRHPACIPCKRFCWWQAKRCEGKLALGTHQLIVKGGYRIFEKKNVGPPKLLSLCKKFQKTVPTPYKCPPPPPPPKINWYVPEDAPDSWKSVD